MLDLGERRAISIAIPGVRIGQELARAVVRDDETAVGTVGLGKPRSPCEILGSPTMLARTPSPPPTRSALSDNCNEMLLGMPLAKEVIPEISQLSNAKRTTGLGASLLARGRS